MREARMNSFGAGILQRFGHFSQRTTRVAHIVNNQTTASAHVANHVHYLGHIRLLTPLVAEGQFRIEPLLAIHHYGNRNNEDEATRTVASLLTDAQKAKMPLITHPVARPHPVTGRKALYAVSGSSFGIVGMPDDEARALLDELARHATQPKYQLSVAYGIGDVVIWDNASLLHSATLVDPAHPRTLWRITLKEPTPSGHAPRVIAPTFVNAAM